MGEVGAPGERGGVSVALDAIVSCLKSFAGVTLAGGILRKAEFVIGTL